MLRRVLKRFDRFQQRHSALAFPFAVAKKFGDDQAGSLAALIAYYGLFSLFPLLLVLVGILGFVLSGNPELQMRIQESALAGFPVVGSAIASNIGSLEGSGLTLGIGIAGTLWAGLAVTQAAQNAMNRVWNIPRLRWPSFFLKRARGILMLGLLGTITLLSTFATGFGSGSTGPIWIRATAVAVSVFLNFALFMLTYQVLTARRLRWGNVFPGAAVAAVLWTVLQLVGSFIVARRVAQASDVYGTFGLVIALLIWIYLGAQILLLCAEINVVRLERLWPRSMAPPPLTDGDRAAYRRMAERVRMRPEQSIEVTFEDEPGP